MQHIVNSARSEFRKSEKPIPEGELRKLLDEADVMIVPVQPKPLKPPCAAEGGSFAGGNR